MLMRKSQQKGGTEDVVKGVLNPKEDEGEGFFTTLVEGLAPDSNRAVLQM